MLTKPWHINPIQTLTHKPNTNLDTQNHSALSLGSSCRACHYHRCVPFCAAGCLVCQPISPLLLWLHKITSVCSIAGISTVLNGFGFYFYFLEEVKMLCLVQAVWCLNSVGVFVTVAGVFSSFEFAVTLFHSPRGVSQIYFLIRQHSWTIVIQKQHSHTSCGKWLLLISVGVLLALAFP